MRLSSMNTPGWKDRAVSMNAGKNALVDLGVAVKNWNESKTGKRKGKKVGLPQERKLKGGRYRYQADNGVGSIKWEMRSDPRAECKRPYLILPAVGPVRLREQPRYEGAIRKCFIKKRGKKWFATLTFERHAPPAPAEIGEIIGIDVGLRSLAVVNGGKRWVAPKPLKRNLGKLRQLDKKLARQIKGSKGREETKAKRSKLCYRIACVRDDYHNKAAGEISNRPGLAVAVLETLSIVGMMKNKKLSRSFTDAGVASFTRKAERKLKERGIEVSHADKWFPSSQICHHCGHQNKTLTLAEHEWTCANCGETVDRDDNASWNLAASYSAEMSRGEVVNPDAEEAIHRSDATGGICEAARS